MRLGNYLSLLTKPELDELINLLNLSDEEEEVYWLLSRRHSKVYIADECSSSVSTVSNRIKVITEKIKRLKKDGYYKFE